MKLYQKNYYTVRLFQGKEWEALKAIRLEALREYPDRLNQPLAQAETLPDEHWQKILAHPARATFAVIQNEDVVGYHFVVHDEERKLAGSAGAYIRREHNWRGIDLLLYQSAIDWAKEKQAIAFNASCKEDNFASIRLFKKYGGEFVWKSDEEETYGDGSKGCTVHYTLDLTR